MDNRMLFMGMIVVGVIIILVSVFAHALGLSSGGFGAKKILGVLLGAILLLAGLWGVNRTSRAGIV